MQIAQPNPEVVQELYRTLVLMGAGSDLLGTVGSWGDSLPDSDVLANLKAWNDATAQEVRERIQHHETLSRPMADIPVECLEMSHQG